MESRPIVVMALAALFLGLFAALLTPTGRELTPFVVAGTPKSHWRSEDRSSLLTSWLNPLVDTAKLLHSNLRMPGDLALEVAASIHRHVRSTSIAPELVVALIMVESGGNPRAVSPKQAVGLMQIHYPVWGKVLGISYEELFDIDTNIRAGVYILDRYLQRHEDLSAALAAYSGNPRSKRYPQKVLTTFSQLVREI